MQPQAASSNKVQSIRSKGDLMAEKLEEALGAPWIGVRPDLMLHKGDLTMEGHQTYVLEDPVSGSYYELGESEAKFFLCLVTEDSLKDAINKLLDTTSLRPSIAEVISFLRMMKHERLTKVAPEEVMSEEAEKRREKLSEMKKKMGGSKSLTNFKIPICRPDPFLTAIYPWVTPLWSRPFLFLYGVVGVVGFLFVCQQIEIYFHTINHLFTLRGAVTFVACVGVVKILHELGHALAAKHYGLYVRRMGIIVIVFIPMFFTDLTDAWKLASRKARIMLAAAGVMVELVIAGLALFAWSVMPDGMPRSLMFYISSVSLFSTFMVNLNPLMRFDGYYVLMDYMRISSLRTRSQAMFQYYRRKLLVGWRGPKPEEHPWERGMVLFGLFSGLYVLVICIGIQYAMYQIIQSALLLIYGIILVIAVLLGRPLLMEMKTLFTQRKYWGSWRALSLRGLVVGVMVGLLFVPIPSSKTLPGFYLYQDVVRLEAPNPGRLAGDLPKVGDAVRKGDVLARIEDRMLEQERQKLASEISKIEATIKNIASGGAQGGYRNWLVAERERLSAALSKTAKALEQLVITAPVSGRVLDVNGRLAEGAYVYKKGHLLTVGSDAAHEVQAYASEAVYNELKDKEIKGAKVSFWDLETPTREVYFKTMQDFPAIRFPNQALFDFAGGPVVSSMIAGASMATPSFTPNRNGQQQAGGEGKVPDTVTAKVAHYPIIFTASRMADYLRHGTPCFVKISGPAMSVVDRLIHEYGKLKARLVLIK